jgi:hypothetical protein
MFTFKGSGLWKHGDNKESYQTFYGKYHPHTIELITYDQNKRWKAYTNTEFETEARRWVNCHYVENIEKTFNKALLYNSNQSSGEVNLRKKDPTNQLEGLRQENGVVKVERTEKRWKVNGFKNKTIDPSVPLFECNCDEPSIFEISNEGNIEKNIVQGSSGDLMDDYIGVRLTLDDPEDKSLELVTRFILNWNDVR